METPNRQSAAPLRLAEVEDQPAGVAIDESVLVPQYNVVLLDDNDHTFEYVIEMLSCLFGHSTQTAYHMAFTVDRTGRVVVDTTHKERAELKRDQIHSFGPDWRIPRCKGSMSALIESVEARG